MNWYLSLPPAGTAVPCGNGSHTVRWEAGRLSLPWHPDAEAELVLGALGGDKPACMTLFEKWSRHTDDLAVLAAGPRSLADQVTVTRDQIERQRAHWPAVVPGGVPSRAAPAGSTTSFAVTRPAAPGAQRIVTARASVLRRPAAMVAGRMGGGEDFLKLAQERFEVLELLALGPAFQFRLSGAVAAAWASASRAGDRETRAPALAAALTGRFAPAAAQWLGIDPDEVTVTLHEGPGWGILAAAGDGARLRASLPMSWLSDVWACGLAVVGGHLVIAIDKPGYPRARVLALRAPGAGPVTLDVKAADPAPDAAGALPRWSISTAAGSDPR